MSSIALKGGHANPASESQIAAVLENRFGDGLVYLPRNTPSGVYETARERGYVDAEGYLTRKGRTLLARYRFQ